MKQIILLLLIFSFYACDNRESSTIITSFQQTGKLQAQVQQIPVPVLLPRHIGIAGEELFIYKEKEEFLFSFFQLPECNFIGNAGTRGHGPNEFNLLDTRSFHSHENGFNVLEVGSNLLKTVVCRNGNLSVSNSEQIFDQGITNNGFYPLADSIYLTLGQINEDNEYCLLNKNTGEITKTDTYPEWDHIIRKEDTPPLFVTYLKSCVVHPNGEKFAAFYGRFKRMRIYDQSAHLLRDVDIQIEPFFTNFNEKTKNQPVYYIGQPYATEDYIYVLCENSTNNDEKKSIECELQIWSWDGDPLACYKFDRKISMITISEEYNKIYALDNMIDSELYIYNLPKIEKI